MLMPDVNVLIYAHRADEKRHYAYRDWLEGLVNGPEPFALSVLVAVAFVRIVTTQRIFADPTPLPTAMALIEELGAHPRCRKIGLSADHFDHVAALGRSAKASGKLFADAQHAALAMREGCTWVSADRDFKRFTPSGLRFQHLDL
jgi:hypothetical protein